MERRVKDYGLDLDLLTFDDSGDIAKGLPVDSGMIHLQVKGTDNLRLIQNGKAISFTLEAADVLDWDSRIHPVILIVYNDPERKAYWLYVQKYLEENRSKIGSGDTITLRIPASNRLTRTAVRGFRRFLLEILNNWKGLGNDAE